MTKQQAITILGITDSTDLIMAENIYDHKCRKLQLRLTPGNHCSDRMKAQTELAQLATAWETLASDTSVLNKKRKTAARTYPAKNTTTYTIDFDLGSLWDDFADMLPVPKPLAILFVVAILILIVIGTLSAIFKGVH
jgi:hypothetical protein